MALYNEILAGRYNRGLQKLFGIKGPPAVPQLSGEIVPSMSMFYGAECRYLEGWQRYAFSATVVAGGVGFRSGMRLRNPLSSGVIAVVEKITIAENLTDSPFVTLGASTDFTPNPTANTGWDNRGQPTPTLICSSSSNTGAILGVQVWQGLTGANSTLDVITTDIQEFQLAPQKSTADGSGAITVYCNILNQGFTVSLWWRERPLEDSEKT